VTSAALIMVLVFSTFATLQQTSMKQLGVGLAVAVLIDATVVRAVLLPATMSWLGDWNWYLPRWLGRRPAAGPVPSAEPALDAGQSGSANSSRTASTRDRTPSLR
jgi:uncharacterized membrane protein YdfJ with MMPL/SSD domain